MRASPVFLSRSMRSFAATTRGGLPRDGMGRVAARGRKERKREPFYGGRCSRPIGRVRCHGSAAPTCCCVVCALSREPEEEWRGVEENAKRTLGVGLVRASRGRPRCQGSNSVFLSRSMRSFAATTRGGPQEMGWGGWPQEDAKNAKRNQLGGEGWRRGRESLGGDQLPVA